MRGQVNQAAGHNRPGDRGQRGGKVVEAGQRADRVVAADIVHHRQRVDVDQRPEAAHQRQQNEQKQGVRQHQRQDQPHGHADEAHHDGGLAPDARGNQAAGNGEQDEHGGEGGQHLRAGANGNAKHVAHIQGEKGLDRVPGDEPAEDRQQNVPAVRVIAAADLAQAVPNAGGGGGGGRGLRQRGFAHEGQHDADRDQQQQPADDEGQGHANFEQRAAAKEGNGAADAAHQVDDAVGLAALLRRVQIAQVGHGGRAEERHADVGAQNSQRNQGEVGAHERHQHEEDGGQRRASHQPRFAPAPTAARAVAARADPGLHKHVDEVVPGQDKTDDKGR